jgi:outer membrane receptor protein involved in Fe transport
MKNYNLLIKSLWASLFAFSFIISSNAQERIDTAKISNLDEIIVTGTKTAVNRNNVPLTISVVSNEQIENSSEINLMPLLGSAVPGLFVTERGISGFGVADGAAGKVSIRGIGSGDQSQLLIMIDGQPQVMGLFGHAFPDMYQTSNFEKVEVIRGPGSVLYGSNAMGGVINLITKKQQTEGFSARISGQAGSYNTFRGTVSTGYKKGDFSVFGAYNHDQTDGARSNSAFNGNNGYLGINYKLNDHFSLYWTGNYSSFHAVDPGSVYAKPEMYSDEKAWADIKRGNTMITLNNSFEKVNGNLKVFFNQGDHSIYTNWVSTDRNYGISLFEGLSLFKNNLIGVGIDWNQYGGIGSPVMVMKIVDGTVKMVPSEYNNKWIEVSEKAVYAFVQQELLNALTLNGGIRFTQHSLYGGNWIPQLGMTWKASANDQLKALVSKGFRSPNVKELYFFPPANPDLKPESLWNYEVGYSRYALNRKIKAGITLFYLKGKNMIQSIPNTAGGIPPFINQNTGVFEHYGAELEASYRINPNFKVNASYSYLHTDVPRIASPAHQVFAGGNYSAGKFDFALSANGIAGLYTLTDNKSTTDILEKDVQNYLLMNAKVNYRILPTLNVFISADNLLNAKYSINYGYPMPGVLFFGGVSLHL